MNCPVALAVSPYFFIRSSVPSGRALNPPLPALGTVNRPRRCFGCEGCAGRGDAPGAGATLTHFSDDAR